MLLNLTVKNSFAHKHTVVKFEKGINYILGKNESGKSELLEMILYAFYGSSALRGAASDYKDLEVTLTFKIKDQIYIVDRSKKTSLSEVEIKADGTTAITVVANSKTAVNLAIAEKLGYTLDVFNKINFSKQLESTAHSSAAKSARLDLINQVNGVDEANALEADLEKKKKALRSEIKGLTLTDKLKDLQFTPNKEYDTLGDEALKKLSEESVDLFNRITLSEKILTAFRMIPTINEELQVQAEAISKKVYEHPITKGSLTLIEYINSVKELKEKSRALKEQLIKESRYIETHAVYSKNYGFIQAHEVEDAAAIHANNKIYAQKEALLKKGDITCPHCLEQFPLMAQALEAFKDVNYLYTDYTEEEVIKAKAYIQLHEANVLSYDKNSHVLRDEIAEIERVIGADYDLSPFLKELDIIKKNEAQLLEYNSAVNRFNSQFSEITNVEELENTLETDRISLNNLSAKRIKIEAYQKEKAVYTSAKEAQEKLELFVNERIAKIDAFTSLIDKSKQIKLDIQNNCIPTLNKHASKIVNKMTGGEHFSLTLSDTFELLLDGKIISSYSGSAQVTANIAFRVALIEMFFKKTFPVFIGDEVDSFADANRASHIHDSLNTLTEEDGYQVILISHHAISFKGNVIDLNKIKK